MATDKNGSEIRVGDVVRESGGEGKSGTILHIHRGYVFAHNKLGIENSGIWVARCTNVITTAAKGGRITAPTTDLTKMNPALQMKRPDMSMAPPQRPGRDPLQGRHVHINKGTYKGHRAIVKETTAGEARLELQTKNKVINLSKFDLSVVEYVSPNQDLRIMLICLQHKHSEQNEIRGLDPTTRWSPNNAIRPRRIRVSYSRWRLWRANSCGRHGWRSHSGLGCFVKNTCLGWSGWFWSGLWSHSSVERTIRITDILWWWRHDFLWWRGQLRHHGQPHTGLEFECKDSLWS